MKESKESKKFSRALEQVLKVTHSEMKTMLEREKTEKPENKRKKREGKGKL